MLHSSSGWKTLIACGRTQEGASWQPQPSKARVAWMKAQFCRRSKFVASVLSAGVLNAREAKNVLFRFKMKNLCAKCVLWMSSPPIYLGRQNVIHVMKWTRPSPSVSAYCKQAIKNRTVGRFGNEASQVDGNQSCQYRAISKWLSFLQWEGLGTRLNCT